MLEERPTWLDHSPETLWPGSWVGMSRFQCLEFVTLQSIFRGRLVRQLMNECCFVSGAPECLQIKHPELIKYYFTYILELNPTSNFKISIRIGSKDGIDLSSHSSHWRKNHPFKLIVHPHGYDGLWFNSWVHCLALLSLVHWHCIYFHLHLPDQVHHLCSSDSRVISEDQILVDKYYVRNLTQIQLCCYMYLRHHLINMKLHFSPIMEHLCVTLCRMSSVAWPLSLNNERVSCFSWLWLY